jgi:hypothetical protein
MPAAYPSIKSIHLRNLLSLLTQNPEAGYFQMNVVEYPFSTNPLGTPRSALLAECQARADVNNQLSGLDINTQIYGLAGTPNAIAQIPITGINQVR